MKRAALLAAGGAPARRLHRGPDYRRPAVAGAAGLPRRRRRWPASRGVAGRPRVVAALPGRDAAGAASGRRWPRTTTCASPPRASWTRARRSPSPARSSSPRSTASGSAAVRAHRGRARDPFQRERSSPRRAGSTSFFEIDLWGRFRRATEAARAELLATEDARRLRDHHPGLRRGLGLLPAPRARPGARDRPPHARRRARRRFGSSQRREAGGVAALIDVRQAEILVARRRADHPRHRAPDRADRERHQRPARAHPRAGAARPARSASRSALPAVPAGCAVRPCSSAVPTSVRPRSSSPRRRRASASRSPTTSRACS